MTLLSAQSFFKEMEFGVSADVVVIGLINVSKASVIKPVFEGRGEDESTIKSEISLMEVARDIIELNHGNSGISDPGGHRDNSKVRTLHPHANILELKEEPRRERIPRASSQDLLGLANGFKDLLAGLPK